MKRPSAHTIAHWYERYISPLSLIGGFLADNLVLLRRVDLWTSNALLLSYLAIAAAGTLVINMIESGRIRRQWIISASPFILIAVQFSFGGLFSGFLSLYSRSAAYATSWIFVAAVAALLIGNERFTRLYARFRFQVAVFFTTLYSFLIFFIPIVIHRIGPWVFVVSGAAAIILILLYLLAQFLLVPKLHDERWKAIRGIIAITIIFNILYFTNMIPPLPLALKEAGVYHSVSRDSSGDYVLSGEPLAWYQQYLNYNNVYHAASGESVYVYTAVFAPTGLSTGVLHQWQYYDAGTKAWTTKSTVAFPINGGRDGGYRGYSIYSNPAAGQWRVNVVTGYGQLIGRVSFAVEAATTSPNLIEQTR